MKREKPFGCGNKTAVGPVKGQPGKFGHAALFCQSYRCRRCRNPKLRKVRARIAQIATEHKLQRMATLTLDPKRIPKGERTDRYIRECWREMRVSLARKFGKSIPFVGVLEFQKNGNAHLHLLVGQYISQTWLSRAWAAIGGGKFLVRRSARLSRIQRRAPGRRRRRRHHPEHRPDRTRRYQLAESTRPQHRHLPGRVFVWFLRWLGNSEFNDQFALSTHPT